MFITKFISWIFNTIVEQRNRLLRADLERDPKYRAIMAELEQGKKRLRDWQEKKAGEDPEARKDFEAIRKLTPGR